MNYDVIFLGGGPAGYEGAIAAAKLGLKTAVVEKEKAGGTCLHWGCIPTKALLHPLKSVKAFKDLAKAGLTVKDYELDVDKLKKYKERVVSKLTKGIELLFQEHGVELIGGLGRLTAEMMITGMAGSIFLIRWLSMKPLSMFSIIRSRMARSGRCVFSSSLAAASPSAFRVLKPAFCRIMQVCSRMSMSSSTTNIVVLSLFILFSLIYPLFVAIVAHYSRMSRSV